MLLRLAFVLVPLFVLAGCDDQPTSTDAKENAANPVAAADEPAATARAATGLDQTLSEAIATLEAKEHVKFLETFVMPDVLAKLKARGPIEEGAEWFASRNATELLTGLKAVQGAEPETSEDGKTVWFAVEEEIAGQNELALINVDGRWYIPNKPPKRE